MSEEFPMRGRITKILATNHTNFLTTDHAPLTTVFKGV